MCVRDFPVSSAAMGKAENASTAAKLEAVDLDRESILN